MHYMGGWIWSTTLPKYKKRASPFDVFAKAENMITSFDDFWI